MGFRRGIPGWMKHDLCESRCSWCYRFQPHYINDQRTTHLTSQMELLFIYFHLCSYNATPPPHLKHDSFHLKVLLQFFPSSILSRTGPTAPPQGVINSSSTLSQTHVHGFVSMGRTCTRLESVSNFLIIPGLQSQQLNTAQDDSLLTLHYTPNPTPHSSRIRELDDAYFQTWNISRIHLEFRRSLCGPSATLTTFQSSSSCLHLHTVLQTTNSAFRLNDMLIHVWIWRLTGFFFSLHLTPMT